MSRPCVDVPTHALALAESKCQKRVPGKYTAKDIEAFYRSLQVVIVKRSKNNQAAYNHRHGAPKRVQKRKKH